MKMPACVLCESETFDCIDGLYFCQSCGTQSQVSVCAVNFVFLLKELRLCSFSCHSW